MKLPSLFSNRGERETISRLGALRAVPPRSVELAAEGRARFLEQAQVLQSNQVPVSDPAKARHKGWNVHLFWRKDPIHMTTMTTLALVFALLFGGAGATVTYAQTSLPDQPLYEVKLASEEARYMLAGQPQNRLDLALEFANRRIEEISALVESGTAIPAVQISRWQAQLENALRLVAEADDEQFPGQLDQVRQRLQEQEQLLNQLTVAQPEQAGEIVQLQTQLRTCMSWVEDGETDPVGFRSRMRMGFPADDNDLPGRGLGQGMGMDGEMTPGGPRLYGGSVTPNATDCPYGYGDGLGDNPWVEGTPTPGSGYGPGPGTGDCTDCTPQLGNPWNDDAESPSNPGNGMGNGAGNAGGNSNRP